MDKVREILEGYKEAVEDNIWELVSFVARNRRNLDLKECGRRCEILARSINEYLNTVERAKELVLKMAQEVRDEHRQKLGKVAQN